MTHKPLLLGSSSPYRRERLQQLGLAFTTASPDIDESRLHDENGATLATRLAMNKARALAPHYPGHLVIGSDQVAQLDDGTILTKPGDFQTAQTQLTACSGQAVLFLTGLALLDADTGICQQACEPFRVHFRTLSIEQIDCYLKLDQPYDCAGSFKMEGLGIALFSKLEGRDPNSLIGLPLIALTDLLLAQGIDPIAEAYRSSRRD